MSDLAFVDRLLEGGQVEWKPLGDLGELVRGHGLPKSDFTVSGVPAIHYGQIYTYYGLFTHSTISFVSPETAATLRRVEKGDVIITNTSENFEDVGTPLVYFGEEPAVTGGHATIFKPNSSVLGMYLAYFTQTPAFDAAKRKYAKGTKVIDVSAKDLAKIEIPIPCPDDREKSLAIQHEIVRILDSFTELTAELTAELAARKKQYNHYRNRLLTFEGDEVEWKALGDVAILRRGRVMSKGYLRENAGEYPVYSSQTANGGMIGQIQTYDFEGEYVSWTTDGANAGTVFYRLGRFSITNVCGVITSNQSAPLNLKFLFHWLSIAAKGHVTSGMGNPKLMSHQVAKIPVPIPFPDDPERSLAEQARIASILDTFDTLTTSLSEGLPREIALRQQQYEYYRDLLLSFPKPAEAVDA